MSHLEVDPLLDLGISGIRVYQGEEAINKKIDIWLARNKGDVWGEPNKGNRLRQYHFRSPNDTLLSLLEMEIDEDLPSQVPLSIQKISCSKSVTPGKKYRIRISYYIANSGQPGEYSTDI